MQVAFSIVLPFFKLDHFFNYHCFAHPLAQPSFSSHACMPVVTHHKWTCQRLLCMPVVTHHKWTCQRLCACMPVVTHHKWTRQRLCACMPVVTHHKWTCQRLCACMPVVTHYRWNDQLSLQCLLRALLLSRTTQVETSVGIKMFNTIIQVCITMIEPFSVMY